MVGMFVFFMVVSRFVDLAGLNKYIHEFLNGLFYFNNVLLLSDSMTSLRIRITLLCLAGRSHQGLCKRCTLLPLSYTVFAMVMVKYLLEVIVFYFFFNHCTELILRAVC